MRTIDLIVIHCSATAPNANVTAADIRRWHVEKNGWADIGYHYVIRRNGEIERGRADNVEGAHAKGHNAHSLGVCMVGGVDEKKRPDSNYTREQWRSLEGLLNRLTARWPNAAVLGHRDLPLIKKDCPCFDVFSWWGGV